LPVTITFLLALVELAFTATTEAGGLGTLLTVVGEIDELGVGEGVELADGVA
jgi:hypothetical protein